MQDKVVHEQLFKGHYTESVQLAGTCNCWITSPASYWIDYRVTGQHQWHQASMVDEACDEFPLLYVNLRFLLDFVNNRLMLSCAVRSSSQVTRLPSVIRTTCAMGVLNEASLRRLPLPSIQTGSRRRRSSSRSPVPLWWAAFRPRQHPQSRRIHSWTATWALQPSTIRVMVGVSHSNWLSLVHCQLFSMKEYTGNSL